MTNYNNSVLYTGVSSDLASRVYQHKHKVYPNSFTAKYNCTKLVFYEQLTTVQEAITREKQIKAWKRAWKIKLIEDLNPDWKDLSELI